MHALHASVFHSQHYGFMSRVKQGKQHLQQYYLSALLKGLVHLKKKQKKTFADNLLTPMSSKKSMSFFLQSKRNEGFSPYNGLHWEPNGSRSK